jgi:Domain of unknown function (DUF4440)
LHDDLLFLAPKGQVVTKGIDMASHREGEMIVEEIKLSIEEIKIIEDTAIVVMVYDTKEKILGNAIERRFRYIRIWKHFSNGLNCFQRFVFLKAFVLWRFATVDSYFAIFIVMNAPSVSFGKRRCSKTGLPFRKNCSRSFLYSLFTKSFRVAYT